MSSHVRHAFHGRARRTLRLGAGAAALASSLLLAPGGALAKDHCAGLAGAGCTLTAPVLAAAAPVAAEALPQDLTKLRPLAASAPIASAQPGGIVVSAAGLAGSASAAQANVIDPTVAAVPGWPDGDVVVEEGTVVKTGDNTPGIGTTTNGATTIKAGSITTDGSVSAGVHAEGSGQISIDVGTVDTKGWRSDGIFATTNVGGSTGGITIKADSVSTSGAYSNAVTATAYRNDVTIDIGQVKASGYASGGIYANAGQGNATVTAGTVQTTGDSSRGLVAYSNGTTKVVVDSVTTTGGGTFQDSNSGGVIATGTSVEVHAGNVSTQGDYSDGIYATSNFAYDNGQAARDISVTAGSVSTAGDHAAGIVAINLTGDNHVDVGTVKTTGDYAPAVYALSVYGNTNIKAGDVSTSGFASGGVDGRAVFGGDVSIDVGKVVTTGDEATAVYGLAYYGNVQIKAGEVSTSGYHSEGVVGIGAFGGNVSIDVGKVTTTGDYSAAVVGISGTYYAPSAGGGVDINISDSVSTSGKGSHGVFAYAIEGDIDISGKGDISTAGDVAVGISAAVYKGNVNIDVGKVETAGNLSNGILLSGLDSNMTVKAEAVTTHGDYATAVSVLLPRGDVDFTLGNVTTDGLQSFGVSIGASNANVHITGDLTTNGDNSIGAFVQSYDGDVNLTVDGKTITRGAGSGGLVVRGNQNATVKAGEVHTYGDFSSAITAVAEEGNVTVNANGITTDGFYSDGIRAATLSATGGVTINNTGNIHVKGDYSNGINVISEAGPIKINNPGHIQVDGYYGVGIYAQVLNGGGAIDIKAGDITTTGLRGAGVIALGLGDVNVEVGNIKTGEASLGVVAISNGGGDVNVKTGNMNVIGIALQAATDGDIKLDVGDIEARGSTGRAILVNGTGDVAIDAGRIDVSGLYDVKGIDVTTEGAVTIRAESIYAVGDFAQAIDVDAGSADIHVTGNVLTSLDYSNSIQVRSHTGDTKVKVDGKVFTTGKGSRGIYAGGAGNVTLHANEVFTGFDDSAALVGFSTGGDVTIGAGSISTMGANSIGIYGAVRDAYGLGTTGDVTITAGKISTLGDSAAGIVGINTTLGGNVDVKVNEISTRREKAAGVYAYSSYGSGTVSAGNIQTRGPASHGIFVNVNQKAEVVANSVSTEGDVSTGIKAWSFMGSKVKAGKVETTGLGAAGIDTLAGFKDIYRGDAEVVVGEVITHGDSSTGVIAHSKYGTSIVTAGAITTSGNGSIGILSISEGSPANNAMTDNKVTVDKVSTEGDYSEGIYAATVFSKLTISAGNVATQGENSAGIRTFTRYSPQTVTVGNVSTDGKGSWGILAHAVVGDLTVKAGTVTTSGEGAAGVRTNNSQGHQAIDVASVMTKGDHAEGVYAFSVGSGQRSIDIKAGSVTTSGAESHGVRVYNLDGGVILYGQGAVTPTPAATSSKPEAQVKTVNGSVKFGPDAAPTRTQLADKNPTAAVIAPALMPPGKAVAAFKRGDGSHDVTIEAGKVEVSGKGAIGVFVRGSGRVSTKVGSVKAADAEALKIMAVEENTLSIGGTVSSAKSDTAVFLSGSDVTVSLAKGAKVSGLTGISAVANGAPPAGSEPGIGLPEEPGIGLPEGPGIGIGVLEGPAVLGTVRIENSGTIAGTVKAISVDIGNALIVNTGIIDGIISASNGDDTIINSGTWTFLGNLTNDFDVGTNIVTNSGVVRMLAAKDGKPSNAAMHGLTRFENSGTLSLQNGVAGDVLTLPGNYVASGKAKLGIDIGGNGKVSDRLVVEGAATGSTSISLVSTDGYSATLLGGPLKIVTVGAGSSANAFSLEATDIGFVRYGLTYDAASRSYSVLSTAGAPVYRFARLNEGAQSIWLKSAEAFTGHMRSSRDLGDPGKRIWGQMSGGVANRDETRAAAAGNGFAAASYDLDYRQDFYGGELGFDAVQGDGVTAGVMAGYTSSTQRFKANGDKGRTDALNVGAYGGVTKGVFFANLLVKYDSFSTRVSSQQMDWDDKIDGHSIGAQGELGARLGSAKFFVEPAASLAWQSTSLGDIEALDQTIAFDKANGLRGRIGARLGGVAKLGGTELTFYGAGDFVHEFKGDDGATLVSGGQRVWVPGARMDDYGQATLGLDIKGSGPVSGFIQGSGTFGSSYSGVDGRAGIRFTF